MLKKIYICGVHSSGKTTLINSLKPKLCFENAIVQYCSELARNIMKEQGMTMEDLRDVECFKELNLTILKRLYDEEGKIEKLREESKRNVMLVFDRGCIDALVYLQLRVGADFVQGLLEEPHISKILQGLRDEDDCIVFVTKPYSSFFKLDGVRVDTFDFSECVAYDEAMRKLMTSLNIPFIYIETKDLSDRADFVLQEIKKHWADVKFKG